MLSYATGQYPPNSIAVGDFNNHTLLDVAIGLSHVNSTGVFLGQRNETLAAQTMFPTGSSPWSVTVMDFNNDYRLDIAVINGNENNGGVLLGYGNGSFAAQTTFPTGMNPWVIAVGDFNNDTRLDIVIRATKPPDLTRSLLVFLIFPD
ncbi:unnamed protein product [Rotaria socialis]|uniref:VCBS repeat-containing protein n=1 Tax=Rotaria socialis TaxID=392032 RepID=A0A817U3U2_9BILA|nr:unnamed protein product [Rotaria socialis]CAF4471233.1 unnamed protein product [Rotaria socialis]